jgi:hypothetical protein
MLVLDEDLLAKTRPASKSLREHAQAARLTFATGNAWLTSDQLRELVQQLTDAVNTEH